MMTYKEARKLIKRISYKPDCEFKLVRGYAREDIPKTKPVLLLTNWVVEDSTGGDSTGLRTWYALAGGATWILTSEKDLITTMKCMARGQEIHEMHEWLKIDEVPFYNPHTKKRAHV